MSTITTAFRFALAATALCAAATAVEAEPRRLVVLEFDGPRTEADAGRQAVVNVLGQEYDVIATKRWTDARAQYGHNNPGPSSYSKAAKQSGVDAVVEGWVQDEGSYKMLTVQVRDAKSGSEIDKVTVKLGKSGGITEANTEKLRTDLDDLLEWVEPGVEVEGLPNYSSQDIKRLGGSSHTRGRRFGREVDETDDHTSESSDDEDSTPRGHGRRGGSTARVGREDANIEIDGRGRGGDEESDDGQVTRKPAPRRVATATNAGSEDDKTLTSLFGDQAVETTTILGAPAKHVPVATPKFIIEGGAYYSSRTFSVDSEDQDAQEYQGVGSKGVSFKVAAYPFPHKKIDGVVSGIGFSGEVWKSPASTVVVPSDDGVGEYHFDYGGWAAAVHYRQPLTSMFSVDGEAGYGQEHYSFEQDIALDVPDTAYHSFHVGGELDLAITDHATVGVGAKYHYVVDAGDLNSTEWYGPGNTSGLTLDGNFTIPLPKRLFVKGDFQFRRYTTSFDDPDSFAESALTSHDSTVNGTVHLGVAF